MSAASARLALLALCLIVSACDSGALDAESPLVGTWESGTYGGATYATLNQPQVAIDPFTPSTGEIQVRGRVSASLRYVSSRSVRREDGQDLVSYGLSSSPYLEAGVPYADFNVTPRFATFGYYLGQTGPGGGETESYFPVEPFTAAPVSEQNGALSVSPVTLLRSTRNGPSAGEAITIQGVLVIPRRRIEAGVETFMSRRASADADDRTVRTVRADGTFMETKMGSLIRSGTWNATPDGTVTFRYDDLAIVSRYTIVGAVLTLQQEGGIACDAACESRLEAEADIASGSVQSVRDVFIQTYTRGRT